MGLDTVADSGGAGRKTGSVEKRSYGRRPLRYLTLVSPVRGEVLNVSQGGMCLEAVGRLAIGTECHFTLSNQGDVFRVSGFVRWCRLSRTLQTDDGDSVPIYVAGVSIKDEASRERIEAFLG